MTHTPDFSAITLAERARGYSSRCRTCALPLISSMEFIGFPCPRPRPGALMDVTCPRCEYAGPAALIHVEATVHFDGHWTVVCPECRRGWVV